MLKRQLLIEEISDRLSQLKSKIAIMNTQGLYDVNIHAQDIVCRLYNAVFDYQLINLNQNKVNVAGIDLGDQKNRIAVQVTSENTSTKIKDTINLFNKKQLYKQYDRLIIAILPWCKNGVKKLAICVNMNSLSAIWADKPDVDDVCVLSTQEQLLWRGVHRTSCIYAQSTWPWIYTFGIIKERLKEIVKKRLVLCDNDDIKKEYVWKTVLSLLNKGSLYSKAIPLDSIEKYRESQCNPVVIGRKDHKLDCFFSLVDQLYEQGIYSIQPTVPVGDKEFGNHFIWSNYSEQRLYNRVVAIYQKALIAYNDYVLYWFSAFASRMRMAILMPGVFRVNLTFKEDSSDGPTISWHMEALPETMKNRVFCTQNESEEWQNNLDQLRSTLEKDTINRPNQREWLGWTLHSEALRCFGETPITDVVFNWIENDLKELHWL